MNSDLSGSCPAGGGRIVLFLCLLGATFGPSAMSHAQGLDGAAVVPKGHWALDLAAGFDFPGTNVYRVGIIYSPLERWQIGIEGDATFIWNTLAIGSKVNVYRSPEDSFLVSLKGVVRGYVQFDKRRERYRNGQTQTTYLWDFALVLEPVLSLEWRPLADSRWSLFSEMGSQHYWGDYSRRQFYDAKDDHPGWSHAVRFAVGSSIPIPRNWFVVPRVGFSGQFQHPLPVVAIGFTHVF